MRFIIRDGRTEASAYVAQYIVDRINAFGPTPDHPFVLGLPTGSSPIGIYKILVEKYKAGEISFRNVVTFNMVCLMNTLVFPATTQKAITRSCTSISSPTLMSFLKNVHILNGNAENLEAECVQYEEAIKAKGGIDLFLGGIGPDGHIAFNEPGSSLASRTRVKTLAYDTIIANSRFFDNDLEKVPRMALTVGIQTILEAREVVIIITGAHKALALAKCIEEGVNHMWTLSSLQMHPHPMIVADEDATLELRVKTVRYWKSIEKVAADEGFEQILPSSARTGPKRTVPLAPMAESLIKETPTIMSPKPLTSTFLAAPATEYPIRRSITPDLIPDRMGSRIVSV
ncbi:glucosamine-6-phosphate isomerase [Botrytis cinerea]